MDGFNGIQGFLQKAVPGVLVRNIVPFCQGVSGAEVVCAEVEGTVCGKLVVKLASGVGTQERLGGELVSRYLRVPAEVGQPLDDCHVSEFVDGVTVDDAVRQNRAEAVVAFETFVDSHVRMWESTVSNQPPEAGYTFKVNSTRQLVLASSVGGRLLSELAGCPIRVNGKRLPSLNRVFADAERHLKNSGITVLSHGDEGAGNGIYTGHKVVMVDNGTAGRRAVAEPIAKMLMWFPLIEGAGEEFSWDVAGGEIVTDYRMRIPGHIAQMLANASCRVRQSVDCGKAPESQSAAYAICVFRELQWAVRRRRETMAVYLLAMGLEMAAGMYGHGQNFLYP